MPVNNWVRAELYPVALLSWLHDQIMNDLAQINTNRCLFVILALDKMQQDREK